MLKGEIIMNCPYCNEEMEKGYVENSGIELQWSKKLHRTRLGMLMSEDTVDIADELYAATAYICKKCEMIVIPYGESMAEANRGLLHRPE